MESLYRDVASKVVPGTKVRTVITTSELEYQTRDDPRIFAGVERIACAGTEDMAGLLERFAGQAPPAVTLGPDDIAFLTYTSGTTGPPKGAMTTHRNVVFNAQTYRDWVGLTGDDVVLGVAPLFHITGLVGHVAISLLIGAPLILMYRLDPTVTIETIRDEKATFTVGSITVFIALMNAPGAEKESLATLTKIFSGGAPIPPSTVVAFKNTFGTYIHNIYGLTETTSPSHGTPLGTEGPVDEASGALSVGVPTYDTIVQIVDDEGNDLPVGEIGELVTTGPQVVAGVLEQARGVGQGPARRITAHRRRRLHGRPGLVLHRRPQEGPDQRGRLQGVAPRGRGRAVRARSRPRGRRRRGAR